MTGHQQKGTLHHGEVYCHHDLEPTRSGANSLQIVVNEFDVDNSKVREEMQVFLSIHEVLACRDFAFKCNRLMFCQHPLGLHLALGIS